MYLYVFIHSVEGVGTRNVRKSILIGFPTFLLTYVLAYLCAPGWCRQDTSPARVHVLYADRANKHCWQTSTTWSSFTNCTIVFSWCIVVMLSLIIWCSCSCVQGAWLWMVICREGGTFAFSAIRLKLAFSKISYCTFKLSFFSSNIHFWNV